MFNAVYLKVWRWNSMGNHFTGSQLFHIFQYSMLCFFNKTVVCIWLLYIYDGDPKISGIVTNIYLKYSYKFEILVHFKVLPLWLDAGISAILPLLETLSKIFNRNAVKGCQRFSLNLCVSKTPPFQNLLHPWVQNVARSEGGWDATTILFLAKNCWMLL